MEKRQRSGQGKKRRGSGDRDRGTKQEVFMRIRWFRLVNFDFYIYACVYYMYVCMYMFRSLSYIFRKYSCLLADRIWGNFLAIWNSEAREGREKEWKLAGERERERENILAAVRPAAGGWRLANAWGRRSSAVWRGEMNLRFYPSSSWILRGSPTINRQRLRSCSLRILLAVIACFFFMPIYEGVRCWADIYLLSDRSVWRFLFLYKRIDSIINISLKQFPFFFLLKK